MNTSPLNVHPVVAQSLATWHRMVEAKDLKDLPGILHPDALFRSPMAFAPYQSAQAVALVLHTVLQVFEISPTTASWRAAMDWTWCWNSAPAWGTSNSRESI